MKTKMDVQSVTSVWPLASVCGAKGWEGIIVVRPKPMHCIVSVMDRGFTFHHGKTADVTLMHLMSFSPAALVCCRFRGVAFSFYSCGHFHWQYTSGASVLGVNAGSQCQ